MTRLRRPSCRGLTFVELIIGIVIMGIVMLALASFTTAVAAGWQHSNQTYKTRDVSTRVNEKLSATIGNALAILYTKPGKRDVSTDAYLVYWAYDGWDGSADGKVQGGEVGLIEYRAASKSLYLYKPLPKASMPASAQADAKTSTWTQPSSESEMDQLVAYYKAIGIAGTPTQLAGPDTTGKGIRVETFSVAVLTPTNARPMVLFDGILSDPIATAAKDVNARTRTYGTVLLRAAKKPTNVS